MTGIDGWNIVMNEEFLVGADHQSVPITSLFFVHTARRSYQWNGEMKERDRRDVGNYITDSWNLIKSFCL